MAVTATCPLDLSAYLCFLQARMADPEVSGNNAEYQKLVRAMSEIQDAVEAYAAYKDVERQLADAKEMLKESEGGGFSQGMRPHLVALCVFIACTDYVAAADPSQQHMSVVHP